MKLLKWLLGWAATRLPEEVAGEVVGRQIYRMWRGGRVLRPHARRSEAPHFDIKQADEAAHARLYTQMPDALRLAWTINWLPSLGQHQRAQLIITFAELSTKEADKALRLMTQIARQPSNRLKTREAAMLGFMKLRELDYLAARVERKMRKTDVGVSRTLAGWTRGLNAFNAQQTPNHFGIEQTPPLGPLGRIFFWS